MGIQYFIFMRAAVQVYETDCRPSYAIACAGRLDLTVDEWLLLTREFEFLFDTKYDNDVGASKEEKVLALCLMAAIVDG